MRILAVVTSCLSLSTAPICVPRAAGEQIKPAGYEMVPLQATHNKLVMNAEIGGRRVNLAVDTGASASILDATFARATHLKYPGDEGVPPNVPKTVASGSHIWRVAWLQNLRAGSMNFGACPIALAETPGTQRESYVGSHIPGWRSAGFDGFLGNDFLIRYGAVIDCLRNRIYFNTDPSHRAHIGNMAASMGYVAVPMTQVGRHFFVPASMGGRAFSLLVDTGAFATTLRAGVVQTLGVALQRRRGKVTTFYGSADIYTLSSNNLSVGEFPMNRPATIAATDLPGMFPTTAAGAPTLGILGIDSLAFNAALIDCAERKLYLHAVSANRHR